MSPADDRAPGSEIVDVVDTDDHVIARVTRAEMRRRNLLHRAVYILALNVTGELFVHRRTETKDIYPGYWDVTIGGVVAAGEEYQAAAQRELGEELGIDPAPLEAAGSMRYEDAATRIVGRVFVVRDDGPFVLQAEEIVEGRFMPLADVERLAARERCCPDGLHVLRSWLANAAHPSPRGEAPGATRPSSDGSGSAALDATGSGRGRSRP